MKHLLAFLLLFPAALHAEPLKAVLVVPPSAIAGSDIYLDASQSTGEIAHYLIFADLLDASGRVVKKGDVVFTSDRTKPRMRSFVGNWRCRLIVVSEDSRYDETESICVISAPDCPKPEPTPNPQPQPKPDPGPLPPAPVPPQPQPDEPVLPIGEFNIARPIYDLAKTIKSPTLGADAKQLAAVIDVLAAQIAAGTAKDMQAVVNQVAAAIKAMPAWQAKIGDFGALIQRVAAANAAKLIDPKGWQKLLGEISTGLKAVK